MKKVRKNISITWRNKSVDRWFIDFIESSCLIGFNLKESSYNLYKAYRNYCWSTCSSSHSTTDFYKNINTAGFINVREGKHKMIRGLKLKDLLKDLKYYR